MVATGGGERPCDAKSVEGGDAAQGGDPAFEVSGRVPENLGRDLDELPGRLPAAGP